MVLWRLLLIWFGPMIGLTGMALFCSVRWNTITGIIAPMVAWATMIALGWRDVVLNTRFDPLTTSGLLRHIGTSNSLLLLALVALIGGLVLLYKSSQWVVKWP